MSGPKRADVVAALNVARNTQRSCATLISRSETAAVRRVLGDAEAAAQAAAADAQAARREADALDGDACALAPEAVEAAQGAVTRAEQAARAAREAVEATAGALAAAERIEQSARELFGQAEAEYERASAAVRGAGAHYLHNEMSWAREAQHLYDRAAAELREAEKKRREAERAAAAALKTAGEARSAGSAARDRTRGARAEAEARRRAQEEARRIAEEGRRRATLALEEARAALASLAELPHARFAPGAADQAEQALAGAARQLGGGEWDATVAAAHRVRDRLREVAAQVAEAAREHARRRAEAESRTGVLAAAVESADPGLVAIWAPDPGALDEARAALAAARQALEREAFEEAAEGAEAAAVQLAGAVRAAAEAHSLNERRSHLGDAIMETLEELGFEVSYEAGSRTEPLRISGQTPDATGRGDFDVALPLDGEVDFRVEAAEGDVACVAAVEALRERLAERGFGWSTTDWGHAEGHAPATAVQQQTEVVQQKIKSKS
ncbi:MAG TPA: hypothetical protein VFJ82_15075 [Longimicrobium sp.]|nr:hypothetical protein [Longimicrobium sp.]